MKRGRFFKEIGLILATTIGAEIFALPYVFKEAGWVLSFLYLVVLSLVMTTVHSLYWRVLVETGGKKRLLGILREHFGAGVFYLATLFVLGGLILVLTAYLILGAGFLNLIFPGLGSEAIFIFWFLVSIPIAFRFRRIFGLEVLGGILMVGLVGFLFYNFWSAGGNFSVEGWRAENLFLPFGVMIFALTGWTAIEPIYDSYRGRSTEMSFKARVFQFGVATFGVALVYLFFVLAVLVSAGKVTPDTISGLLNWPEWELKLLGIFGIFALATSYWPIALEIKNLTVRDLKFSKSWVSAAVLVLPLLLVFLGLKSFFGVTSFVGGVFLAGQYLFLILAAEKLLGYKGIKQFWLFLLAAVFLLGAVYQVLQVGHLL
ncbi:MAG: hypothetical protein HY093_02340 [Candidatus Liptonbacteria bacterium]|nr:hypothetical protein [Candidatus Liptonbacteria bacterium]